MPGDWIKAICVDKQKARPPQTYCLMRDGLCCLFKIRSNEKSYSLLFYIE